MRKVLLSGLVATLISAVAVNAQSFDEAFKGGETSGQVRFGYITQDNPAGIPDSEAGAIGGQVKYETGTWNGLKMGVAAYVSQNIHGISGEGSKLNGDFFGANGDSFAYIGEAYLDYTRNDFNIRVGRQQIDTPLADTDDIRMLPNTFEAAIASYGGIENTTLLAGYVKRWAGFDSGDDISRYKRLDGVDSKGAAVAAVIYEGIENLGLQGWYYGIDNLADAVYLEASYSMEFPEGLTLDLAAQSAHFSESQNSNIDGRAIGLSASFGVGALSFGAAINVASNGTGEAVTNGFGGGPYFTSMEETTIDGLNDVEAHVVNAEADFASLGIDGLSMGVAYGNFESGTTPSQEVTELDFVLVYAFSDALEADLSYADIEDENDNLDGDWNRWLLRVNYNF